MIDFMTLGKDDRVLLSITDFEKHQEKNYSKLPYLKLFKNVYKKFVSSNPLAECIYFRLLVLQGQNGQGLAVTRPTVSRRLGLDQPQRIRDMAKALKILQQEHLLDAEFLTISK